MPKVETWKHVVTELSLLDAVARCNLEEVAAMTKLRLQWSTDEITIAANLVEARRRAVGKLESAETIVADPVGVQQATSTAIASHKATRFAGCDNIVDLCCGIGSDLQALPQRTIGVDIDPLRCWMAQMNTQKEVRCADVTTYRLPQSCVVHIDPSRRDVSGKRLHLDELTPSFSEVLSIASRCKGGCIKLSPGIDPEDVDAIDQPTEIEYIEENNRVVQAVVWFGSLAHNGGKITATSMTHGETMTDEPLRVPFAPSIGAWLLEPNAALERSGLHGTYATHIGAHESAPNLGLLCADVRPTSHWCIPFEVLETTPLRLAKVAAALRNLGCTQVEVKTRNQTVDPNYWQKQLSSYPHGPLLTVFALRLGKKRIAVITRRHSAET